MTKREIILELTDIQYHSTKQRPAKTVKGALNKGLGPNDPAAGRLQVLGFEKDGRPIIAIPAEWQSAIDRGELEITIKIPDGGLPQALGKDAKETLARLDKKKRNMGRHRARQHETREKK